MRYLFAGILSTFFMFQARSQNMDIKLEATFQVYNDLIEGLKGTTSTFPELVIVDDSASIALYSSFHNQIKISNKALGICESFGNEYTDALAFILGHELIHSTQRRITERNTETSFLKNVRTENVRKTLEEEADIQGAFNAYLAGYDVQVIGEDLLDRVYDSFGLTNKRLNAYPTLSERKKSFVRVMQKVDTLVQFWEAGTFLLAYDKFDLAFPVYEEILKSYQGKEIYNNLGVTYLLKAIHFSEYNFDNYVYPIEIDFVSRLQRKPKPKDSKMIPIEEQMMRDFYLKEALSNFEKALTLDPAYIEASINLASTYMALGQMQRSESIADLASALVLLDNQSSTEKLVVIKAISKISQSEASEVEAGLQMLKTLNQNPRLLNRELVETNLYLHECEEKGQQPYPKTIIKPRLKSKSIQFKPSDAVQIGARHKAWFYYHKKDSYRSLHLQNTDEQVTLKIIIDEDFISFQRLSEAYQIQLNNSGLSAVNKGLGQIFFRSKARDEVLRVEFVE